MTFAPEPNRGTGPKKFFFKNLDDYLPNSNCNEEKQKSMRLHYTDWTQHYLIVDTFLICKTIDNAKLQILYITDEYWETSLLARKAYNYFFNCDLK